jgi:hypothetical protein
MKVLFGLGIGIIFVIALAVRIYYIVTPQSEQAVAAVALPAYSHVDHPLGNGVTDYGPLAISGTAIMDFSTGLPPVPYISYEGANGDSWTKQLVFKNSRGCAPGAGDLPCSPGYSQLSAYPQVVTGSHITVYGYIRDNRFLVESLSIES